jgi:ribosome-associated protein
VAILPSMPFTIPEDELEVRATRGGGPGGQHVNTASTRVEVRWNVRRSVALRDDQRARLLERLASRLDARGTLRVVASERRSQKQNRDAALERLTALVRSALRPERRRIPTAPSHAAVERRLEEKRRRGHTKRDRRRPISEE